jgi:hypothetical protein
VRCDWDDAHRIEEAGEALVTSTDGTLSTVRTTPRWKRSACPTDLCPMAITSSSLVPRDMTSRHIGRRKAGGGCSSRRPSSLVSGCIKAIRMFSIRSCLCSEMFILKYVHLSSDIE